MVDFTKVPPLDWQTPIVDPKTGQPSAQFIRLWQQTFQNAEGTEGQISGLVEALEDAIEQIDEIKEVDIIAGVGLDGGGPLGDAPADITIDHADSTVVPDTYGSSTLIPVITVDQQGHITGVTEEAVEGVPAGGTTGQVLGKVSDTDYDVNWINQSGGGGGGNWWFNPPTASAFTLLTGDGTNPVLTDDTDVGLMFDLGTPVSGDKFRGAYRTIPSPTSDWSAEIAFNANYNILNYTGFGFFLQDTTTGRLMTHRLAAETSGLRVDVARLNSTTSYNSNVISQLNPGFAGGPVFLRIRQVSNVYYFDYSPDGKSWVNYASEGATSFFGSAADRIGFGNLLNSSVSQARMMGSISRWTTSFV